MIPAREGGPGGEFSLQGNKVIPANDSPCTLASIGVIHSSLIENWPRGEKFKLLPHYEDWVARGLVTGTLHTGTWENVTSVLDLTRMQSK